MKTLETLNEKLQGKLWEKDGKKRIYLDEGYNTKKMKTTTYVEQNEAGNFIVKCFIDCPSQDWNWIKSQQEQVIENVESRISELEATTYFYVVDENTNVVDDCSKAKDLSELYVGGGLYIKEFQAKRFVNDDTYLSNCSVKSISKEDFEKLEQKETVVTVNEQKEEVVEVVSAIKYELGKGIKVQHERFGKGEIIEDDGMKMKVLFETCGEKPLLKKFVKLTYL